MKGGERLIVISEKAHTNGKIRANITGADWKKATSKLTVDLIKLITC